MLCMTQSTRRGDRAPLGSDVHACLPPPPCTCACMHARMRMNTHALTCTEPPNHASLPPARGSSVALLCV